MRTFFCCLLKIEKKNSFFALHSVDYGFEFFSLLFFLLVVGCEQKKNEFNRKQNLVRIFFFTLSVYGMIVLDRFVNLFPPSSVIILQQ